MPRNITITFDDGSTHVYANAPDNVTPEQVQQRAAKEFAGKNISAMDGGRVNLAQKTQQLVAGGILGDLARNTKDFGAGAIRGAGAIGSTLISPYDIAKDVLNDKGFSLESNRIRRKKIDQGLQDLVGADPSGIAYKGGKLTAEIAGTAGAGGLAADVLNYLGAAKYAPQLVEAIRTYGSAPLNNAKNAVGKTAGNVANLAQKAGINTLGGAISGGATAGLVDPEQAKSGAIIGAAASPIGMGLKGIQSLRTTKLAEALKKYNNNPVAKETLDSAIDLGFKIPPNMVAPNFKNRLIESIAGKHATQQAISNANIDVAESLVKKELGLPADSPLNTLTMMNYRANQYKQGYDPIKNVGKIRADDQFTKDLNNIYDKYTGKGTILANDRADIRELVGSYDLKSFHSSDVVDSLAFLREKSGDAFRKGDTAIGKAYKDISNAYENLLQRRLKEMADIPPPSPEELIMESEGGRVFPDFSENKNLLSAYQAARKNMAKSHTIENMIVEGGGTVDPRKIAQEYNNSPLKFEGDLKTLGAFSNAYPKAMIPDKVSGSPGVNNLRPLAGGLASPFATAVGGLPLGLMTALGPSASQKLAENLLISKSFQKSLLEEPALNPLINSILKYSEKTRKASPVLFSNKENDEK